MSDIYRLICCQAIFILTNSHCVDLMPLAQPHYFFPSILFCLNTEPEFTCRSELASIWSTLFMGFAHSHCRLSATNIYFAIFLSDMYGKYVTQCVSLMLASLHFKYVKHYREFGGLPLLKILELSPTHILQSYWSAVFHTGSVATADSS